MMEILKPPGKFEIVAIMAGLEGETPLQLIELGGRIAYRSQDKITNDSAAKFVKMLRDEGHESVLEHSCMTVRFLDVSRGFTHELVRHRLASFTQESTRYVDESNLRFVCPPDKNPDTVLVKFRTLDDGCWHIIPLKDWVGLNEQVYRGLLKEGWHRQDARQILPIGTVAPIGTTANFREWRHIFELRCSPRAHWEIRSVMVELLKEVQKLVPVVFEDFEIDESVPCAKLIRD